MVSHNVVPLSHFLLTHIVNYCQQLISDLMNSHWRLLLSLSFYFGYLQAFCPGMQHGSGHKWASDQGGPVWVPRRPQGQLQRNGKGAVWHHPRAGKCTFSHRRLVAFDMPLVRQTAVIVTLLSLSLSLYNDWYHFVCMKNGEGMLVVI